MGQPLEGSLGPRSRAAEEKVFREILASQGTGVLIPNVLSLTQRDSVRERQRPRPRPPDLTQVKTQLTIIILTTTTGTCYMTGAVQALGMSYLI